MTVYVDQVTDYGDAVRGHGQRSTKWAHLTADTPEELHAFAGRLGLKREWFQHGDTYRWHYDVTPTKRDAALRAGAQEIDRNGLVALLAARREGRSPAAPKVPAAPAPGSKRSKSKRPEPRPAFVPPPPPMFGNAGGWATVMERAAHCCQCTGQCGATHRQTQGRCATHHGEYGGKGRPSVRLEAAPKDVAVREHEAARLPVDQLMAWCPTCRSGALRKAKPAPRRSTPPQENSLF
ncbi:DUF4031 domain-containing protein [Streptomyces olivaceus]|uniref:DUF4031 domain-containing protein n=1 Tax=Streptomyces olivaceus TaxID=47716 RepID=UPI00370245D6